MKLFFQVNKAPDAVFKFLTDMELFVSVHPVITQIDNAGNGNYLVHETLKFGPLPLSFTYPVTIEKDPHHNVIVMRATAMKLTKIEMRFTLSGENGSTNVDEEIKFRSPLPVISILERIFRMQHQLLFRNINSIP